MTDLANPMSDAALDVLRGAIGRTEESRDIVSPSLVDRFRATLGYASQQGTDAPLGIHWCLSPPAVAPEGIDIDGHPKRGGFIPPIALPRRMWAGGAITFIAPIQVGDTVIRRSRIADIAGKTGRSGQLVFVTVEHELSGAAGPLLRERQDIVYREASRSAPGPEAIATLSPMPAAEHAREMAADEVLLFRYSALTFNAHRIHYDLPYAVQEEGYPGLVVHGPLLATLLLNHAAEVAGRPPVEFTYRGIRPLIAGASFSINANASNGLDLWAADAAGVKVFAAVATIDGSNNETSFHYI